MELVVFGVPAVIIITLVVELLKRLRIVEGNGAIIAALVVGGIWLLYTQQSPEDAVHLYAAGPAAGVHKYLFVGAWAALGCLGAWAQFSTAGPSDKAAKAPGEAPRGKRRPWRKRRRK